MEKLLSSPVLLMLCLSLPVLVLLLSQLLLTLKAKKRIFKLIPCFLCILGLCAAISLSAREGAQIYSLLLILYFLLLLMMCGIGWVIAYAVIRSERKKDPPQNS